MRISGKAGLPLVAALASAHALLLLAVLPATGWLVRKQGAGLAGDYAKARVLVKSIADPRPRQEPDSPAIPAEALRRKDDVPLQIAIATEALMKGGDETDRLLGQLAASNPGSAAARAAWLRAACRGRFRVGRPDLERLAAAPDGQQPPKPADPAIASEFERHAAEGEKLDPGNAFFPVMRCMALLGARSDAEAVSALRRAVLCDRWNDYASVEQEGRLQLAELRSGHVLAAGRLSIIASTLFPHYAEMRSMARALVGKSILMEEAGQRRAALDVRMDLMKFAGRLRTECPSGIGALVGAALQAIAISTPAGAPMPAGWAGASSDERETLRVNAFADYVRAQGQPALAEKVEREQALAVDTRDMMRRGIDLLPVSPKSVGGLVLPWLLSGVALMDLFWLLVAGALLAAGRRLANSAGLLPVGAIVVVIAAPVLLAAQSSGLAAIWAEWVAVAGMEAPSRARGPEESTALVWVVTSVCALIAPAVTALIAAAAARARRVRFSEAMAGILPWAVLVMVIVYGGLALRAAGSERRHNAEFDAMLRHEGRYMAGKLKMEWPGTVL